MKVPFPYLVEDVDRHGNLRRYVRLKNRPKVRLKETPGTVEFTVAYNAAVTAQPVLVTAKSGSLQSLCDQYFASDIFKALDKNSTQSCRRGALNRVCNEIDVTGKKNGDKPAALLRSKDILGLRDKLAATPGAARDRLKALKALFAWATPRELVDSDPTVGVKFIKSFTEGHHSWSEEEVAQYEAHFPVGTKARLAEALMIYTAGRREDAVRLGRANIKVVNGVTRLQFTQAKNEHRKPKKIDVKMHPELEAILKASGVLDNETFLLTDQGKKWEAGSFGNWFGDRCDEAGVPGRAHGLRKACATRLADAGATPHEIMAWTGHSNLAEVQVYTEKANKAGNADTGLAKVLAKKAKTVAEQSVPPKVVRTVPLKGKTADLRAA